MSLSLLESKLRIIGQPRAVLYRAKVAGTKQPVALFVAARMPNGMGKNGLNGPYRAE
jgi:hypothetical protein